jgi:NADPH:quinone reductase-like Zn-dependent oxidoreductase
LHGRYPKEDEVLIKVCATTVNRSDAGVRQGHPFFSRFISGFPRPRWKILGTKLVGAVEAADRAVTEFTAGDHVFGVNLGLSPE